MARTGQGEAKDDIVGGLMTLSSFLANLIIPLNLCITLIVVGCMFYLVRLRKTAVGIILFAVLWGVFWSLPASSLWAGGRLEQFYSYKPPAELPKADVIVVLGGHTAGGRPNWFEPYAKETAITRSDTAAELYHAGRAPFIIVSGAALDGGVPEARVMANTLIREGVPENAIIVEERSLTTRENGVYTQAVMKTLDFNKALLVTSALHRPRSMGVFKGLGMNVTAAPSPPQIVAPERPDFAFWLPDQRAFSAARSIIKEYAGMLVYWVRGWL